MFAVQLGRCVRVLALMAVWMSGGLCLADSPPNDDCAGAIEIVGGSTPFTLDGASRSGPPTDGCAGVARDLWYRFTPANTDLVSISVCNNFQAITVSVYYGTCGMLEPDSCLTVPVGGSCTSGPGSLFVFAAGGAQYYVRLSSEGVGALGGGVLTLSGNSVEPAPFTYQGQLKEAGAPAEGPADLRFSLFTGATGGSQAGLAQTFESVQIASDGTFTVELDFRLSLMLRSAGGSQDRFLEIAVRRPAGAGPYVTLSPRQLLTSAPYATIAGRSNLATHAVSADTADSATVAIRAVNGGSGGVRLFNRAATSVSAAALNPVDWTDIPASEQTVSAPAGVATLNWNLSGSTNVPASVFEIRSVVGESVGTPMRMAFNPAMTHLAMASTSIATTGGGPIVVKLQVRRVNGIAQLLLDENDSVSWTLTVFANP